MNQFDLIFNATLNLDHSIDIHIHKKYASQFTKKFFLYCNNERICELNIQDRRETNNHFHYVLNGVPALTIGKDYRIYDDRYLFCYLDMNVLLKNEKICSLYRCDDEMGAIYTPEFTTFRLFSPLASNAYVVYEKDDNELIVSMKKNEDTGVFETIIFDDLKKCTYNFLVKINGELISANDPYAKALTAQSFKGVIVDFEDVKVNLYNDSLNPLNGITDAIIYELSVRDMTSMKDSSFQNKGKFLGLTESNCFSKKGNPIGIDYIRNLGATHVQLLPIFDFCTVCDENSKESYNWGYDPLYYNVPEGSYSTNTNDPYSRIIELKQMISSFHKNGIRVVMDVVFNHVFNLESSCFEKLCPSYYFRFKNDGTPSNGSFCGNEFNSSHPMARKFIIDSCLYWVKEFGIDGFRFDLMGLLDIETINLVYQECKKINPSFIVYGEGWDMPSVLNGDKKAKMDNASMMKNIGFFNDRFRDIVKGKSGDYDLYIKGYLLGDSNYRDGFKHCYLGSCLPFAFPPLFDNPSQSINFIECHDNATIYDKLKVSNYSESEKDLLKRINLLNSAVILSFGVPLLHAGQEIGLSKKGVYNSYNSPDEINQFDYDVMDNRMNMVKYLQDIISIRKKYSCFRNNDKNYIQNSVKTTNLDNGGLLIEYNDVKELNDGKIFIIFNPSFNPIFHELEDDVRVIFNENGYLNEGVVVRGVQASPISLTIGLKEN